MCINIVYMYLHGSNYIFKIYIYIYTYFKALIKYVIIEPILGYLEPSGM